MSARARVTKVSVTALDTMDDASAAILFEDCCGSRAWVRRMVEGRPYGKVIDVLDRADRTWRSLGKNDRLEAFQAHPRIGQKRVSGQSASSARMSADEQAASTASEDSTKAEMARLNAEFEKKFGHIFIISASGLPAESILEQLRGRLAGSADQEFQNASEEQRKITRLRLERMLEDA